MFHFFKKRVQYPKTFCKIYFNFLNFNYLVHDYAIQRMDILKAKVYDIHEEDYNIHRLRFHSAKKIMMEIGFVHL